MSIHVGSKLRVELPFIDVTESGVKTPIDLSSVTQESVRIWKPDGSEIVSPVLGIADAEAGEAFWEADEGVLDVPGV
ncbi:MAG: hypothetical protein GEU90_03225 [Gemmatimonas sp.]|nr:hypothetical protein [Gemmatimonas sp.]